MSSTRRTPAPRLIAAAAATACLSAIVATGAQAASKPSTTKTTAAKTVTACVNKKSGATRVLLGSKAKKKCPKGWSKVTWSVAGKAGTNGKNGSNGTNGTNGTNAAGLQVRDSTGRVLGAYAGLNPLATIPIYEVLAPDGGLYSYYPDGELAGTLALQNGAVFQDAACTGPAYIDAGPGPTSSGLLGLLIGPPRFVYRSGTTIGGFGPARAWKYTTTSFTVPAVPPKFYGLDPTGACVAIAGPFPLPPATGDTLVVLASTPAPSDGVGPLTVG